MRLKIIDRFYSYQLKKNPNYLKEIKTRKYISSFIFFSHFLTVSLLSFFAYTTYDNLNYKYVLASSILLNFLVYFYIIKVFGKEYNNQCSFKFLLIVYTVNWIGYYNYLDDFIRFMGMLLLICAIFNTINILSYSSTYRFVIKPFEDSVFKEGFEIYNVIIRKIKYHVEIAFIIFGNIISMWFKHNFPSLFKQSKVQTRDTLLNEQFNIGKIWNLKRGVFSIFSQKEKTDFSLFLRTLSQDELLLYARLSYHYPHFVEIDFISFLEKNLYSEMSELRDYSEDAIYSYITSEVRKMNWLKENFSKEDWTKIKNLEPELLDYLICNNYCIFQALYCQDFSLSNNEFLAIKELEKSLKSKVIDIESNLKIKSWQYQLKQSYIVSSDKEVLLGVFNNSLTEKESKASLIISLQKFFKEMYEINPEIFYEEDMKAWLKIYEYLEKIFFYNIYMVESIDNGEWKIKYDLSFPKDKLGIIFLQDKMNHDIPINKTENTSKKLLKF